MNQKLAIKRRWRLPRLSAGQQTPMRNPCACLPCRRPQGRIDAGTPVVTGNRQAVGFEPPAIKAFLGLECVWCKQHHECLRSRASSVSPSVSHPSFFHMACSTAYRCWARGAGEKQRRGGRGADEVMGRTDTAGTAGWSITTRRSEGRSRWAARRGASATYLRSSSQCH